MITCTFCDEPAVTAHVRDSRPVDYYCIDHITRPIAGRNVGHWITPTFEEIER